MMRAVTRSPTIEWGLIDLKEGPHDYGYGPGTYLNNSDEHSPINPEPVL